MAGDTRKEWQAFKKQYPEFEKSKSFKSDLGPSLDKLEKARSKAFKIAGDLHGALQETNGALQDVQSIVKDYKKVLTEMKSNNKGIEKDFDDVFKYESSMALQPLEVAKQAIALVEDRMKKFV